VAPTLPDDVAQVEDALAAAQIMHVQMAGRAVAREAHGQAGMGVVATEEGLVHLEAGIRVEVRADAVEVRPGARKRLDRAQTHLRSALQMQTHQGTADTPSRGTVHLQHHLDLAALAGDQVERGDGVGAVLGRHRHDDRLPDARIARDLEDGVGGGMGGKPGVGLLAETRYSDDAILRPGREYGGAGGHRGPRRLRAEGQLSQLHGRLVHLQPVPGYRRWSVDRQGRRCGHQLTAPSISSRMRLFISTAYSSGSSLLTGFAKPLTTIVEASCSGMPRLIR